MTLPKDGKNIIFLMEGGIFPYIENFLQPHVNYIKQDLEVYSLIIEQESLPLSPVNKNDQVWHKHFDNASSNEGNFIRCIVYSPLDKIHQFTFRHEFDCTNNIAEFEASLLCI